MATIPYQILVDKATIKVLLWETLTETNDVGQPYMFSGFYPDKCVQIIGSVGSGGHLKVEGCNGIATTGQTWATLHDATEDDIDMTAVGIKQVLECPYQIRPHITAGTSVDIDCYLIMRKA